MEIYKTKLFQAACLIVVVISVIFSISTLSGGNNRKEKDEAIRLVKLYEMQTDIPSENLSTKGLALSVYVEKYLLRLMQAGRIVEGGNWVAELNSDKSGYLVNYEFKLGKEDNLFQWEVINGKISPINGKAKTITPELDQN
jgi:hypothetical protein